MATNNKIFRLGGLGLGIFIAWLVAFFGLTIAYWEKESSPQFIVLLFILPLLHFGVVAGSIPESSPLRGIFLWTIGGSALCHFLMWTLYIRVVQVSKVTAVESQPLNVAGYVCIFLAAVLTVESYIIVSFMMKGFHPVSESVKRFPFLSINFFMAIFLYITFFLSFALAFHDRPPVRVLFADNYEKAKSEIASPGKKIQDYHGRILFSEGSPEVKADESFLTIENFVAATSSGRADRASMYLSFENARSLREMVNLISAADVHTRFQLVVWGHANEKELTESGQKRFNSNLELSRARAALALESINYELRRHGYTGRVFPLEPVSVSSADLYLYDANKEKVFGFDESFDSKLMAEIGLYPLVSHVDQQQSEALSVRPPKLELLDYVYFMVYTISTTGYGDMVPIAPESKFVTSMANLIEIFFLVVFVNVVLSCVKKDRTYIPIRIKEER